MWRTNRAPSQLPGIPSKPPTPAEPAADDLEDYTEYTADYPTPANNSLPFNPLSAAYNFRMFGQTGGVGANFPPDASTLRAYATATAPTIFSSSRADPTDSSNSSQSLSNSIALNKLKLDSHTAKLKEQLLSKRRELPDKAVTPPAQSEAGTTTFVPHSMPQEISKNHMPASDNDIAALIADIGASTATSPSETRKMDTGQLRRESTSTIKTANTPRQTSYGEPRDIKYPKSGTNGQQRTSNHSHIQAMPAAAQLPRPAAAGPSDIVEEGEIVGSPMEVDNVAEPVSISMPRPRKPMADTEKVSGPAEKGSGSGSTEKRPTLTERQAVSTEKRFASVDKRATTLPERRPSLDTTQQTPQKQPKPTGAAQANHTEGDKDLQDWLIFTNWHDLEYRTQFLSRRRKIRALEAEKQALLEQEEAESASRRQFSAARGPLSAAAVTPVRSALAISQPDNKAVPNTPTMDVEMEPRQPASTKTIPAKRELEEEEKPAVTEKYTRVDDSKGYSRARASSRGRSLSPQKSPPRKDSHGYWNERSPEQRLPRTTSYYDNKYSGDNDGARRYDNYRSNRDGPGPSLSYRGGYRPNSSYRNRPKLELGRKGDSRFFMIKSFNESNVSACMEDGLWTTQVLNGEMLTAAFAQCRNVILFFSINKSGAFQGYARMMTAPSPHTPVPKWMERIHWETSPPFRIDWINTTPTPFQYVSYLNNSLNEDRSVVVGKDCQEIEEETARALIREMDKTAGVDPAERPPYREGLSEARGGFKTHHPYSSRGGRPWTRGGGSFGRDSIKKEDEEH